MKRYSILSLLFMFFVFGGVAQVDSLILPFNATDLTEMQKKLNPDYLAYPLALASQVPEINCNQIIDCMEPVDLGLSVLWATCNVGAEKPEDYGDYFAWGEVKTKAMYDFATYKYFKGTSTMTPDVTKYCNFSLSGYNGFVDNKIVLDTEDDAAAVNWGGDWRIPTDAELSELREKCTWVWTVQNGVNGYKVVGLNGNSIFLPAAGYIMNERFEDLGKSARYWSSSLELDGGAVGAYSVNFSSNSVLQSTVLRSCGHSVRPVLPKELGLQTYEFVDKETICENELPFIWRGKDYNVTGVYYDSLKTMFGRDSVYALELIVLSEYECNNQVPDCIEAVDLGLSVKWAACNVGAEKPEDYGDYFAWGETTTKTDYSWVTYKYCAGTEKTMTKYCNNSSDGNNSFTDDKTVLDLEDDAATANWGGSWRMPTYEEMTELREQCIWTWTTQKGVKGYKVVGKNGNYIFLPAAGYCDGSSFNNVGSSGNYWSSSLYMRTSKFAYYVSLFSSNFGISFFSRNCGFTVRPVCP